MNYITSNIPYFKAWVRREYTTGHDRYHGEFLHAMVIGVTTLPMRTLSFQVLFTGCDEEENVHGGRYVGANAAHSPSRGHTLR